MFPKPWQNWLSILVAILAVGATASLFLGKQELHAASNYTLWASQALAVLWTLLGQWRHRHVRWIKWSGWLLLGTVAILGISGFYLGWNTINIPLGMGPTTQPTFRTVTYWGLQAREALAVPRIVAIGLTGVWLLGIAFFGGFWLLRQVLVGGNPLIGVARALVDEAIRMKVVLVLVVLVILLIPLLPLSFNPTERLEYRIQTFISHSTTSVWLLLSLMTILVTCTSICFEIANRQIYLTMTKSVSKLQYLLGKLLGICLINLWLITVAGIGIYVSTLILSAQPARDATDRQAVQDHILSARTSVLAVPPDTAEMQRIAIQRYLELREQEPDKYGNADFDPNQPEKTYNQLAPKLREGIQNYAISRWQTIKPKGVNTFVFRGVGKAKEFAHDTVQLRLKPRASPVPPEEQIRMALVVNGRPYNQPLVIVQNTLYRVDIPLALVDRNGDFELQLYNVNALDPENTFETTITFPPGDGMEMVYPVGTFEGNLFRGMIMIYAQLVFLGMLSLMAGTFLSFPVACLWCVGILIAAVSAGYLSESLDSYASVPVADLSLWQRGVVLVKGIFEKLKDGQVWESCRVFIRLFGEAFLLMNPNFAAHSPIDRLIDGRMITDSQVVNCVLRIGVASTSICGLIAWLIWRRRELARVIV